MLVELSFERMASISHSFIHHLCCRLHVAYTSGLTLYIASHFFYMVTFDVMNSKFTWAEKLFQFNGYKNNTRLYHQYATKCGHKLVRSYNLEILNLGYCTFSTVHAELGIRKCFMKLHNDTISPNNLFLRKLDTSNKKIHCDSLKYLITTKFYQI